MFSSVLTGTPGRLASDRQSFDSIELVMDTQYDIVALATVASTQDEARRRFDMTGVGSLVVADHQVVGRGRQGREWAQPDRGLYASLVFSCDWESAGRTLIPLLAAIAMRRAIAEELSVDVGLKWPNDLMVDGLKVGGILVETSGDTVVVGCGVNLWWNRPMAGASSLLPQDPGGGLALTMAEAWAGSLSEMVAAGPNSWPRREYEGASVTLGAHVHWDAGSGSAVGVADNGALLVDCGGERIEIHSGEVHMFRDG